MKALTLQQPYATLIANGSKRIETRKWHPRENPGVIAIASSKKPLTGPQLVRCDTEPFQAALAGAEAPAGVILAVARCHYFVRTEDVPAADLAREGDFGDYRPGRWAWYFEGVVELSEPVPVPPPPKKGKKEFRLGLWTLPDKLLRGPLAAAVTDAIS